MSDAEQPTVPNKSKTQTNVDVESQGHRSPTQSPIRSPLRSPAHEHVDHTILPEGDFTISNRWPRNGVLAEHAVREADIAKRNHKAVRDRLNALVQDNAELKGHLADIYKIVKASAIKNEVDLDGLDLGEMPSVRKSPKFGKGKGKGKAKAIESASDDDLDEEPSPIPRITRQTRQFSPTRSQAYDKLDQELKDFLLYVGREILKSNKKGTMTMSVGKQFQGHLTEWKSQVERQIQAVVDEGADVYEKGLTAEVRDSWKQISTKDHEDILLSVAKIVKAPAGGPSKSLGELPVPHFPTTTGAGGSRMLRSQSGNSSQASGPEGAAGPGQAHGRRSPLRVASPVKSSSPSKESPSKPMPKATAFKPQPQSIPGGEKGNAIEVPDDVTSASDYVDNERD